MSDSRLPLRAAVGLIAGAWFGGIAAAADLSRLDQLLQAGDSVALTREFRSGQYPPSELVPWLRRQAEVGHALPQYELAERLKGERLDEALGWYAKGRLARLLDEEGCNRAGKTNAAAVGWLLDLGYQDLDALARKNEPLFSKGMQAALAVEAAERRVSAAWICGGEANLLPRAEAQAARAKARERLARRTQDIASPLEAAPVNPAGFKRVDLSSDYANPTVTAWLDSRRLLFSAAVRDSEGKWELKHFAWDLDSDRVNAVARKLGYQLCYFDGYVRYKELEGPEVVVFAGAFGKEEEIFRHRARNADASNDPRAAPEPEYHGITCRPLTDAELTDSRGKTRIIHEHGVLRTDGRGNYLFYPGSSSTPIKLPYQSTDWFYPEYAPFLNAYYFKSRSPGSANKPARLLFLHLDGRFEEHSIPYGPWERGGYASYLPTRAGTFMWSRSGDISRGGVGTSGGYLVRGSEVTRLIAGWPQDFAKPAVSPDGCQVAMSHSPASTGGRLTLTVINFCARGS